MNHEEDVQDAQGGHMSAATGTELLEDMHRRCTG